MADQYPYQGNYKRAPVDVFLQGFLGSLEKIMAYKMQKSMEEDAATKRFSMEKAWAAENAAAEASRKAKDPEYQSKLKDADQERELRGYNIEKAKREAAGTYQPTPEEARNKFLGIDPVIAPFLQQGGAQPPPPGPMSIPGMPPIAESKGRDLDAWDTLLSRQAMSDAPQAPVQGQMNPVGAAYTRNKLSTLTGSPAAAEVAVPMTPQETAADAAIRQRKTAQETEALVGKKAAEREAEVKSIIADHEANGDSGPVAKAKAVAFMASKSDTAEAKELKKVISERQMQEDTVRKANPTYTDAQVKQEVNAAAYAKFAKDLPPESDVDADTAAKLGEYAYYGVFPPPAPGYGMGQKALSDRKAYYKNYVKTTEENGGPLMAKLHRIDTKSESQNLPKLQDKMISMQAYNANMQSQIKRVQEKVLPALNRVGATIANRPISWWQTHVPGSADEALIKMYAVDIGTESAKISTDPRSIAAVPEGLREEWTKIHDVKLPIAEQFKVYRETGRIGEERVRTTEDAYDLLRAEIGGYEYKPRERKEYPGAYELSPASAANVTKGKAPDKVRKMLKTASPDEKQFARSAKDGEFYTEDDGQGGVVVKIKDKGKVRLATPEEAKMAMPQGGGDTPAPTPESEVIRAWKAKRMGK